MIIVEGPDGSGKSTLANTLSKQLGWPVHRNSGPPRDVAELFERVDRYRGLPEKTVCDRHAGLSELVYGPIIRGTRHPINPSDILPRITLIYCRPPFEVIKASHMVKDSDPALHLKLLEERIDRIVETYDRLMAGWGTLAHDYRFYDFTKGEFKL